MFALLALTTLSAVAGVVLARPFYAECRAEATVAASTVALACILAPIQALGWSGHLHRAPLGVAVAALGVGALSLGLRARPAGRRWRSAWEDLVSMLRLPVDAFVEARREGGSIAWLYAATVGVVLWTTWLAWLAPSGSWDGLWYHEPMVGFALQRGDFGLVPLPTHLDWVNGYPRTSENLMLWVTVFSDRRLIDAVPAGMVLVSLAAFVALARRHGGWPVGALGLGCVLVTIPGVVLQLRSTYIDVTVLAAFLAALTFTTRPTLRVPDLWLAALALGVLGGTKANGIAALALFGALLALRVSARAVADRSARMPLHLLGASLVIAALALPSYARNWVLHHNPIWPLRYESRLFGTFEGPHDLSSMQWPAERVLHELFGTPSPGEDYHDTKRHSFGYGLTFVGLPLMIGALLAWAGRVWRAWRDLRSADAGRERALGSLLVLGSFPLASSPAFYWARYALPTPAVGLVAIHAWLAAPRRRRLGEAAIGAMGALNLITLFWAAPGWDVPLGTAMDLMRRAPAARVEAQVSHNLLPPSMARLREARIGRGDVVAFDDEVAFVGNLWNEAMSNRVEYVPFTDREAYLQLLAARNAEWVVVRRGSREDAALGSTGSGYRLLGHAQREDVVFERLGVSP